MQVVPTQISSVTVYRNGALVVRGGKYAGPGAGDVEVRNLPLLFASDTLRVRPASGSVLNLEETVRLQSTPAPLPVDEEARAKLYLEMARVDDELRTMNVMLELMESLCPELPDPQVPVQKLVDAGVFVDLVSFAGARAQDIVGKRRKLELARRDLDKERRKLDERVNTVPAEVPRVLRGASFKLDRETAFDVEYFVYAARWVPTYSLQLTNGDKSAAARLVTAALVAQATGEDWSGASLAVCTADLSRETTLPTLSSWRIGRAQQAPAKAFRALPSDLPSLFYGYDRSPRREMQKSSGGKGGAAGPSSGASTTPATGASSTELAAGIAAKDAREFDRGADTDELRSFERLKTNAAVNRFEPASAIDVSGEGRARYDDDEDAGDDAYDAEQELSEAGESYPEEAPIDRVKVPTSKSLKKEAFRDTATKTRGVAFADMPSPSSISSASAAPMGSMAPGAPPAPPQAQPARSRGGFGGFGGGRGDGGRGDGGRRADGVGGGGGAGGFGDDTILQSEAELPPRWRTAYMRMAGPDENKRGMLLPLDPIARLAWLLEAHDVDGAGRTELQRAVHALQLAQARLEHQPLPRGTQALLGTHFPSVMQASAATDVPGDGTFYRVEVRVDEGPASTEHKAVPRESNDVWRTCRLDVKGAPLPAGPLAVYEDGAFRVNARLDGSGGGKPLDVNLGVDPDVRVMSRTVHVNQSEKGIVSSTSRVEHKIKMEVRSTRKQPASIVLYDRLPTPADTVKDVVVNVVEEKPPIKRTNKDAFGNDVNGAFEWRVVVMPGDTHTINLTYAIDLPSKTELEGGNRRE